MAIRDDLIEAFSDSIDRLNDGEALEDILTSYPDLANQLRPMLEAGLLIPRARFSLNDVTTAQEAIEPTVEQTIRKVFGGWNSSLLGVILVIVIGGGLLLAVLQLNTPNHLMSPAVDSTITETSMVTPSATTVVTNTPSPTTIDMSPTMLPHTATATIQPDTPIVDHSMTPSATVTESSTPTELPPTMTHTPTLTMQSLVVIQGPIEAITTDTVTIFNQTIDVSPDNPILSVMEIGDVVRIEGEQTNQNMITLVNIDFINVTVVVFDGDIWRGDDCGVSPPDWAEDDATEWFIACTSNQPSGGNFTNPPQNNSNNSGSNSGGGNRNNNDDDNDDDGGDDDD